MQNVCFLVTRHIYSNSSKTSNAVKTSYCRAQSRKVNLTKREKIPAKYFYKGQFFRLACHPNLALQRGVMLVTPGMTVAKVCSYVRYDYMLKIRKKILLTYRTYYFMSADANFHSLI